MKKPDEREIIRIFQNRFGRKSMFRADDLEVMKFGKMRFVTKSDMWVQSTDAPPGMKFQEMARKSIVSCVSDFACKGVEPRFATIALALPKDCNEKMINELADGFFCATREFGLKIVGGDVNEGSEIIIEVSMFGVCNTNIPTRGGSKIGDIIVTTGPFGYCSACLKIVLDGYRAGSRFREKCKEKMFNPKPRLEFGLKAAKYFSASIDSSDGLSLALYDLSKQSGKKFVVTNLPTTRDVFEFAEQNKMSLKDLVFCGGEEYEIVATVSPKNLQIIRNLAKRTNTPLREIGHVARGRDVILVENSKSRLVKRCGWIHLRS